MPKRKEAIRKNSLRKVGMEKLKDRVSNRDRGTEDETYSVLEIPERSRVKIPHRKRSWDDYTDRFTRISEWTGSEGMCCCGDG